MELNFVLWSHPLPSGTLFSNFTRPNDFKNPEKYEYQEQKAEVIGAVEVIGADGSIFVSIFDMIFLYYTIMQGILIVFKLFNFVWSFSCGAQLNYLLNVSSDFFSKSR